MAGTSHPRFVGAGNPALQTPYPGSVPGSQGLVASHAPSSGPVSGLQGFVAGASALRSGDLASPGPAFGRVSRRSSVSGLMSPRGSGPKAPVLAVSFKQRRDLAEKEAVDRAVYRKESAPEPLAGVRSLHGSHLGVPMQGVMDTGGLAPDSVDSSGTLERPASGLSRQLLFQVGRQVATSIKQNDHNVVFQVNPPSLGRLQMHVEKKGAHISVRIVSEKEKAGEVLSAGKHDLRVLLADHGIKVDRIDVQAGGTFDFMGHDGSPEDRNDRGRSSPRQPGKGSSGGPDPEARPLVKKQYDGVISVLA